MDKARAQCTNEFEGSPNQLFQDLSWITLQKQRHLRPLLLKNQGKSYRWGFPFALVTSKHARTVILRAFKNLPSFCSRLDITLPEMMDWDLEAPPPAPPAEV